MCIKLFFDLIWLAETATILLTEKKKKKISRSQQRDTIVFICDHGQNNAKYNQNEFNQPIKIWFRYLHLRNKEYDLFYQNGLV